MADKIRIGVVSLGCSKNRVDSEVMISALVKAGYEITDDFDTANVIIVNTCGFIEEAKSEAIDTILEMSEILKINSGKLMVTGCLAQRYAADLMEQMPEIDTLLGVYAYDRVVPALEKCLAGERQVITTGDPRYLDEATRIITTPKHYAYLKIAEGCNNRCAYCAIPMIRGPYVSRSMDSLLDEAKGLIDGGVKELEIVAQDTTRYGQDLGMKDGLLHLIDGLSNLAGLERMRIMYAYPESTTESLMKMIGENDKICNYLDLPIQHISDRVLKLMNRRGGSEAIYRAVNWAEKYGITLRTSLIAGFPTETEGEFEELLSFIKEHPFEHLGVFAFSPEEDTKAAEMVDYAQELKEARRERIFTTQMEISRRIKAGRIGSVQRVIIDEMDETGFYIGRSQYEAPETDGVIYVTGEEELSIGDVVDVEITQSADYDLMGQVVLE